MGTGHANNFLAGKIENGYISAVCDINPKKFKFFKYFKAHKSIFSFFCFFSNLTCAFC